MARVNKATDFSLDNYEEFYEDHHYSPVPEEGVMNSHQFLPRVGWALDIAREEGYKTVLDLGCLEGYAALTLAKHAGMSGCGVDLSSDGIRTANEYARVYDLPLQFTQGTCEEFMGQLVNDKQKFDMILCFELIEHVKDIDEFRDLMDQCLAENGSILVSTPDFEAPTYGKDDDNKCHIRLFTTADEDYEAVNVRGETRKATSMAKWIGKGNAKNGRKRIISEDIWSELIHCRYR